MKNSLLALCCFFSTLGLCAQNLSPLESIYFATASAELDATAIASLEQVVQQVAAYPDYRLQLTAHTDSRGQTDYNYRLAEARATTVHNWLQSRGLPTDQFEVQIRGEAEAGSDWRSAERQQLNRRVDLYFTGWSWSDLAMLQDSLVGSLQQTIQIDAGQDVQWSGTQGGQFYLPAGSLLDASGQVVTGPVDIHLLEAYTLGDMLQAGLTTLSPEGILQTGGMLYWEAEQAGEPLQLAPQATLSIGVPTEDVREDMTLFYGAGHRDAPPVSWENSTEPVSTSFPRLRLAERPKRPAHTYYIQKFLKVERPPVTEDPRYPTPPTMTRPRQPHEPLYERIIYRPSGLERLTLSKAKRAELTEALRREKREAYEARLAKYQQHKPVYDSLQQDYRQRCREFEARWAREIDADGLLQATHPHFSTLQAQADSLFALRMAEYQRDSIAYEKYRARKLADYDRRIAAFEQAGAMDQHGLQHYMLTVNRMGWANIDRFLKLDPVTPILAYEARPTSAHESMVFLLFPERNIILRMPASGTAQYALERVPIGEKAAVMAVKIADQRVYLARHELIVGPESSIALEYAPARLRDVRRAMEGI